MRYEHLCCRICRVCLEGEDNGVFRCPNCKIEGGYEIIKTFCED